MNAVQPAPAVSRRSPPAWGVGIGYRACIHREIMSSAADIDFLEIPAEDYVDAYRCKYTDPGETLLTEAVARFPVVGHGSDVSVGSAEPAPDDYLQRVGEFVERVPVGEYSEHLTCTRAGRESVHSFIAIPFTDLGVAATVANARRVARTVGLPFMLENVCYHFPIPGSTMREEEFIRRVVTELDCGILLDLTNVHINAHNYGYDPREFIAALPADRILQAHYCGVLRRQDGYLLDTHSEVTPREVWDLVDHALATTGLRALILERDDKFLPWAMMKKELRIARDAFRKHRPATAPSEVRAITPPTPPGANSSDDGYSRELALFQQTLMSMLISEELGRAVDRNGEIALQHTGLGRDERLALAAIPRAKREMVGEQIRMDRIVEKQEREQRRRAEWVKWGHSVRR